MYRNQGHKSGVDVALHLHGGGGALLRVAGAGCGELLRFTRQWWHDPRTDPAPLPSDYKLSAEKDIY